MLAKLRNPAFRFLLVFAVCRRSQIIAQFGDGLIGSAGPEMKERENQARIGKYIFTLAKHVHGFGGDAVLSNQRAAQHIVRGHGLGIDLQRLARFGFRFLISIQKQEREGKILMRERAAGIERDSGLVLS